jgi:hypothetical protein
MAQDSLNGLLAASNPVPTADDYGAGARWDEGTQSFSGAPKGLGFLGPLQAPNGMTKSEFSIDGEVNGSPMQYPSIVPTLSRDELSHVLNMGEGDPMPASIQQKAAAHAQSRVAAGKSPFAEAGEQQTDLYPEFQREAAPLSHKVPRLAGLAPVLTGLKRAGQ